MTVFPNPSCGSPFWKVIQKTFISLISLFLYCHLQKMHYFSKINSIKRTKSIMSVDCHLPHKCLKQVCVKQCFCLGHLSRFYLWFEFVFVSLCNRKKGKIHSTTFLLSMSLRLFFSNEHELKCTLPVIISWDTSPKQCLWFFFAFLPLPMLLITNNIISMSSCRPTLAGAGEVVNFPKNVSSSKGNRRKRPLFKTWQLMYDCPLS